MYTNNTIKYKTKSTKTPQNKPACNTNITHKINNNHKANSKRNNKYTTPKPNAATITPIQNSKSNANTSSLTNKTNDKKQTKQTSY